MVSCSCMILYVLLTPHDVYPTSAVPNLPAMSQLLFVSLIVQALAFRVKNIAPFHKFVTTARARTTTRTTRTTTTRTTKTAYFLLNTNRVLIVWMGVPFRTTSSSHHHVTTPSEGPFLVRSCPAWPTWFRNPKADLSRPSARKFQ